MSLCGEKTPKYTIPLPTKLLSFLKAGGERNVLDIGCGYGRACFFLHENGCNVVGIDVNKSHVKMALEEAKKRYISEKLGFLLNDACAMCFPEASFDTVTMLGVLTLIPKAKRQKIISEAWRVLKPSGYLFIEEFGRTWRNPVYAKRYREDLKLTGEKGTFTVKDDNGRVLHLAHHFTRKEIQILLKRFKILSFEENTFTSYYHGNRVRGFIILAQKKIE